MKRRLASSLLLSVLLAAALYFVASPGARPGDAESDVADVPTTVLGDVTETGGASAENVGGGWEAPVFQGQVLQATVDGAAVRAQFEIGIAGTHPSLQAEGLQINVPALAAETATLEVRAVSADGARAFWDIVPANAEEVELVTAHDASLRVTSDAGHPVARARLRIARAAVGLVVLDAESDATGAAVFAGLPPGRYHVTVEAPGHLTATRSFEVRSDDAVVDIVLDAGAGVSGVVTAPDGTPVAGARVLVHVGRAGGPEAARLVPEAVAETDRRGRWAADSLRPGPTSVTVFATGFAPTRSASTDTSFSLEPATFDVELAEGATVTARVVDAQRRAVPGARVSWRDERTGFGETKLVDEAGRATFHGLPLTALLDGAFADWATPTVALDAVPDPRDVELMLQRFDASKLWRVRIAPPASVEVWGLAATDEGGARCVVETIGTNDFALRDCGPGGLTLIAETSAGLVETVAEAADGMEVTLPAPTPVELTITGAADEDWGATHVSLARDGAVVVPSTQVNGPEVTARAATYPGRWELVVANDRVGTHRFPVAVARQPVAAAFVLRADARLRLWVVDRYDAPVNGAWVMLFEDGRPIDVARSGGQLPAEFAVRPPWSGTALAVDPRRGEGSVSLRADGEGKVEQRMKLSSPVMTQKIPANRPSVEALEARLGAHLVADAEGFVIDFEATDSPGLVAGLARGDRLVTAWPDGRVMRVVVKRGGDYLDVAVP